MPQRFRTMLWLAAAVCLAQPLGNVAAQTQAKKPISYDAYDSWMSIQGTKISRDGT